MCVVSLKKKCSTRYGCVQKGSRGLRQVKRGQEGSSGVKYGQVGST
jgi:hypothetical protein